MVAHARWDSPALLGQRSVTIHAPTVGLDVIMFVIDKQFVFLKFSHPLSQNATSRERLLQIGRVIEASIRARRESGEDEPDPDQEPPTLTVSATPTILWPPNHKMIKVAVAVQASDTIDPHPQVTLVGVTSSAGDPSDIQVNADSSIFLRAERLGNESQRTYTITYRATDSAGNSRTASTTVTVPHDKGNP